MAAHNIIKLYMSGKIYFRPKQTLYYKFKYYSLKNIKKYLQTLLLVLGLRMEIID